MNDPDVWREWGRQAEEPPDDPYEFLEEEEEEETGDEDGDPELQEMYDERQQVIVQGEERDEMEVIRSYITLVHHRL